MMTPREETADVGGCRGEDDAQASRARRTFKEDEDRVQP
jgi:hypothetical protein